ncbi:phage terminase large subunit [Persephonella sp.]
MSLKKKALKKALEKVDISVDTQKAERVKKAENDFWFFCSYYLSHKFFSEPAPYQKLLIELFNTRDATPELVEKLKEWTEPETWKYLIPKKNIKGIINIEPRGHGKTTRAEAFLLWNAIFGKHKNIMVIAASQDAANEIVENIKLEIDENERIYEDFGDLEGDIWKEERIKLKNGVNISARGILGRLRGSRKGAKRPDLILCDDVLKDEAAESATIREKIYNRFKRAVMPMADRDAFIIFTNTILHHDDLPSRLLNEYEQGKHEDWFAVFFATPFMDRNGDWKALWKSYWDMERLRKKKEQIGSIAFEQEFRNRPRSEEDMVFKPDWIEYYQSLEIANKKLEIITAVDPATGKAKGDYSAIITVGKDKDSGIYYVLDAYADKISDLKLIEKIIEKFQIFKPKSIIFETVAFQEIYKNQVMREASKRGIHLPIKPIKPKVQKEVRIQKLSPLIENGLIKFKENQKLLIQQLLEFPKGSHDDLIDALEMAISGFEIATDTKSFVSKFLRRKTIV